MILVTGGLGFIGSHFVRHILNTGPKETKITNLDRLSYGANQSNLEDVRHDPRYSFIKADINDVSNLDLERPDIIVNFAAESHVDRSISDPAPFIWSNIQGTFKLLEYARRNDTSVFVQISTDEVYGEAAQEYSFRETDALNPSSPYSASKAAADLLVNSYRKTYGLKVLITRCTNNYGPNQYPEKLIPKTIVRAIKGLPMSLYGGGSQIRDWIFVTDHVKAICKIIEKGTKGDIYNISSSKSLSNLQAVQTVLSLMKSETEKHSKIISTPDRPGHDKKYSLDATKLKNELGWNPETSFEDGLSQTVRWYIENQNWWGPLITPILLAEEPWKIM